MSARERWRVCWRRARIAAGTLGWVALDPYMAAAFRAWVSRERARRRAC